MKIWSYYNEIDPFTVLWIKELIRVGVAPPGYVDDRSITEVQPEDLKEFTQCHFFAGILGWVHALRLANWPDDRPVWTSSMPCQPFSTAGTGKGVEDDRHLAPHMLELIEACHPPVVFGEQVAAAIKKDNWTDDLMDSLEASRYETSVIVLPACGLNAPHIRQRQWWVAILKG